MIYGIIFRGNSTQNNSIFKIQQTAMRIIVNSSTTTSCHKLFTELLILTLHSPYIYSLLMCAVKNRYLFKSNSDVHILSTRYNSDLHLPTADLTAYLGNKMYNHLPLSLKELFHDVRWFRLALKRILSKTSSILWINILVVNLVNDLDPYLGSLSSTQY
jgi:hypothetical protein